jgi:hypothetical protein
MQTNLKHNMKKNLETSEGIARREGFTFEETRE